MRRFADALAAMPNARSPNAETFFAEPSMVLATAAVHFGIDASPAAIAALVGGTLLATYSKNPGEAFDNTARLTRRAALEQDLASDLDAAVKWPSGTGGCECGAHRAGHRSVGLIRSFANKKGGRNSVPNVERDGEETSPPRFN